LAVVVILAQIFILLSQENNSRQCISEPSVKA